MKSLFDTLNTAIEQSHALAQLKGFSAQHDNIEFIARESSSITLATVREGESPSVLVINGYLSEAGEEVTDWLSVVDELYPNNKVIHVRWHSGDFTDIARDDAIGDKEDKAADNLFAAVNRARDMSPSDVAALVGGLVTDKLLGHWKKSYNETRHAGRDLAKEIHDDPGLHGAILMGYSLGAGVVRQTLLNLDANHITTGYLLAGAVSAEAEQWTALLEKHTKLCLINSYSDNDYVLKSAYGAGTILDHKPVGLTELKLGENKQVVNLNASAFVTGHMNFKNENLGKALSDKVSNL